MSKSICSNQTVDEMLDRAAELAKAEKIIREDSHLLDEEDPQQNSNEAVVLVYPSSGADAEVASNSPQSSADAEMEEAGEEDEEAGIREALTLAPPAEFKDPKVYTRGLGPLALEMLDRLMKAVELQAATSEDYSAARPFSYAAKIRLINESKDRVAPLWTEFHEAIFLDKKMKFKPKPVGEALDDLLGHKDFNCTCVVVHTAVANCQHYNMAHVDLCRREALKFRPVSLENKKEMETQTEEDKSGGDLRNRPDPKPSTSMSGLAPGWNPPGFSRGKGRGRGLARGGRAPFRSRSDSESKVRRDLEIERDRLSRELKRREEEIRREEKKERERSRSVRQRSPRRTPPRNRERPHQPAQDRLREERKRFEDPKHKREAEKVAESSRKEAEKIKKALDEAVAGSPVAGGERKNKKKPGHGDCALKPDGTTDWENCPVVTAPPGMKAVVVEKEGRWHVTMETK
jgi:hypothetical protein